MIQRLKDSTDKNVAHTLQKERSERVAKTQRLRELRLERDAATKSANAPGPEKPSTSRRRQGKKATPD